MRIRLEFKLQDFWIGAHWKTEALWLDIWICIVPCFPIHLMIYRIPESARELHRIIYTEGIIKEVATRFLVTEADLKSRKRDDSTALARQVAMYLMRQETDGTLDSIGQQLGGRSPATVTYGYQKIAREVENNGHLREIISDIQHCLAG